MKKKLIVYNIFIVLILISMSVYAAVESNLNIKFLENDSVKPGEEFSVVFSLKDMSQGVDSVEGYLDIDENVIENVTVNNIVKNANNKVKVGNNELDVYDVDNLTDNIPDTGIFFKKSPADSNHDYKILVELPLEAKITTDDIIEIKFKVKTNIEEKAYAEVAKFIGFTATSDFKTLEIGDKSVSINVVSASNQPGNTNENIINNVVNNKANNIVNNKANNIVNNKANNIVNNKVNNKANNIVNNKASNTQNKNNQNIKSSNGIDNSTSNKILPSAGATSIVIRTLVILVAIGFAVYLKYRKYKNI